MSKVPHPYVIEAKDNQPLYIRIRDVLLTAIMWLIYLYLMLDFIEFVKTLYHWEMFGIVTVELEHAFNILSTMEIYIYVVIINSLVLISWAIYNRIRFKGVERRKARPVISATELAQFYSTDVDDVKSWQDSRILIIHHDSTGKIEKVEPKPASAPTSS